MTEQTEQMDGAGRVTAYGHEVAADEDRPLSRRGGGSSGGRRRRGGGPRRSGGARSARRPKRKLPPWLEWPLYLVVTLSITALIKTFIVQMYSIPSESMEPTTYKGDRVVVDQFSTWFGGEPARGQVIVFHDPHQWLQAQAVHKPKGGFSLGGAVASAGAFVGILPDQRDDLLIKRIIGVGGDTVECRKQDGPVYVNGTAVVENYINNHLTPCYNGVYSVKVPKDMLWVLGDNRRHSGDSSYNYLKTGTDAGFVPRSNVVGHVVGVISWLEDKRAPEPADTPGGPGSQQFPGVVTAKTP